MMINRGKMEWERWEIVASGWMNHHIENVENSRASGVLAPPPSWWVIRENRNFAESDIYH